jgi:general secretion pathway protein K
MTPTGADRTFAARLARDATPRPPRRQEARRQEDGFVIVAVLWILAALAALVSVYSVFVIDTAVGRKLGETRLEAEALIAAGVELAAGALTTRGTDKKAPALGAFAQRIGNAQVEVSFCSEGARIDLNEAKKPLLAGLFVVLGATSGEVDDYADRIIVWRRPTQPGARNDEAEASRRPDGAGMPRRSAFQNVGELRLVPGLPAQLIDRMLPYVTVFNGRAEIDPMIAAPTVLSALPGMSPARVQEVLDIRKSGDSRRVLDVMGQARSSVATDPRKASRVEIRIGFDNGRRVAAEIVVLVMDGGSEPYRVLAWRDDIDEFGT